MIVKQYMPKYTTLFQSCINALLKKNKTRQLDFRQRLSGIAVQRYDFFFICANFLKKK